MKIITTNIRYDNAADGDHQWDKRKEFLAQLLLSHKPHFICSQEGRKDQLFDFESLLKFNMVRSHRKWIASRMYPTIYTGVGINILASGDLWLSETPLVPESKFEDSLFPRLATWCKAVIESKEVILVNAHLDHRQEEVRMKQITVLISEIQKLRGDLPLIICGDFNSDPKNDVMKSLLESDLKIYDPWVKMNQSEVASHHNFNGDQTSGSRIDWILLSHDIKIKNIKMLTDHKAGIYPSDHFPVIAEIIF